MPAERATMRLGEIAQRHGLSAAQSHQLGTLLSLLAGDEHAPTSVSRPERAVDVHVADSLMALEIPAVASAGSITDLGSGAGLPGLVLAVALPGAVVWLLESQARKCAFLEAAAAALGLANVRVVCARAEDWGAGAGRSDIVAARAVAAQPVVLEYAAPLLRVEGRLVDWRGRRAPEEEQAAARAAAELGMERMEIRRVEPFPDSRDHHLHVFAKVAETPGRFPRRAGIARKRPLGAPLGA
jgi:16S rRNA (guanine527-N7)-methyltransferase